MAEPRSERLIELLHQARAAIVEAQEHWGAVLHLTGDRRNQRRHDEVLSLLDAMIRDTEDLTARAARDRPDKPAT